MIMNTVIFSPPAVPGTIRETVQPAAATSWLDTISPRRFRLLLLLFAAAGATLASEGMQRLAALRGNYYLATDRAGAVSPLPYGMRLPALSAAAAAPGPVRALVRADSAGGSSSDLCALASALKGQRDVAWLAATPAVEPCIAASASRRVVPVTGAARTELARARWVLLDARGGVLHSGRTVPAAADVRELAALLSPAPTNAR
jgi:hypothetical protein